MKNSNNAPRMNFLSNISKTTRSNFITYGIIIVVYVIMQILVNAGAVSNLIRGQLIPICVFATMAVSLNLCVGILGELSLGHAGFMSVGAFTGAVAIACMESAIPSPILRLILGMLIGAVFAAIAGVIIGIPVLKLNGDYLAIVTLAFGEIIRSIFTNVYVGLDSAGLHFSILNRIKAAEDGKMIINGAIGLTGIKPIATFFMAALLLLVTLIIVFNLINSKTGRAVMALRDNQIAAQSIGISIPKFKLMAFVISAAIAGAAGTMFAENYSTMLATKFDFNTSILILVFVVLGGLGNIRGSIIAAAVLTLLPELLRSVKDYRMLAYAIILIVVMIFKNSPSIQAKMALMRSKKAARKKTKKASIGKEA